MVGEHNGNKRRGRSSNKLPFVIALSTAEKGRPTRRSVTEAVNSFTTDALTDRAQQRLALGAFRTLALMGHAHTVIDTSGACPATEVGGSHWLNIALGNVNLPLNGI